MVSVIVMLFGIPGFIGAAWLAKKVNKPYLTWLGSLVGGMLLVSYSLYQTGFTGISLFAIGSCVVIIGVIGSSRYQSSVKK